MRSLGKEIKKNILKVYPGILGLKTALTGLRLSLTTLVSFVCNDRKLFLVTLGLAHREVPNVPQPTAGQHCDIQRQMLQLSQRDSSKLWRCFRLLQISRRVFARRNQPRSPRVPLLGALEETQVWPSDESKAFFSFGGRVKDGCIFWSWKRIEKDELK